MGSFSVSYRKNMIRPFVQYGRFRGKGSIEFYDDCFRVSGRHILSLAARLGLGFAIFVAAHLIVFCVLSCIVFVLSLIFDQDSGVMSTILVTLFFIIPFLSFASALFLSNWIVEHVWLHKEEAIIPYSTVNKYVIQPRKNRIGIDYQGTRWTTPVVLQSNQWSDIQAILREKMPEKDVAVIPTAPVPFGHMLVQCIFAFLCSFAVCFITLFLVIAIFFPRTPWTMTGDPLNTSLWFLVMALMLIVPFLSAMIYVRRNRA